MSGSNWDFSQYVDPPRAGKPEPDTSRDPGAPTGSPSAAALTDSTSSVFGEPTDSASPRFDPFDSGAPTSSTGADLETGRPPVILLAVSALVVVVGGLLAVAFGRLPTAAVVAWVLSGPLAISLLAAFTSFDTRQRARALYSNPPGVRLAYVGCLVLCGVAVCVSALRIASWVGRL